VYLESPSKRVPVLHSRIRVQRLLHDQGIQFLDDIIEPLEFSRCELSPGGVQTTTIFRLFLLVAENGIVCQRCRRTSVLHCRTRDLGCRTRFRRRRTSVVRMCRFTRETPISNMFVELIDYFNTSTWLLELFDCHRKRFIVGNFSAAIRQGRSSPNRTPKSQVRPAANRNR